MPLKRMKLKARIKNAGENRIKFLGYTGDAVDLTDYGFDHPVVYDLESLRIANQKLPLNYNHRTKVGETDKIQNTKQTIRGTGSINEDNKAAKRIQNSQQSYEASMGLDASGAKVSFHRNGFEANGQEFAGPHYLIKNTLLDEMTITEQGRDVMTKVHRLSRMELSKIKGPTKKRAVRTGPPPRKVRNTPRTPDYEDYDQDLDIEPEPGPSALDYVKLRRLENKFPQYQDIIFDGIEKGWSYGRIKNAVRLECAQDKLPTPPKLGKEGNNLLEARLTAALCANPEKTIEKHYGKQICERVLNSDSIGLKELMVIGANQLGANFTGYSDVEQLADFIGKANVGRIENTGFSTFSMPNLFKRAGQIVLEEAWEVQDFFAPGACYPTSHSNFLPHERYRPSGGSMWEGLDNMGRVKHGSLGKEKRYLETLDTKAQMLGFNREMIENDDMGVIKEILNLMVEGALIVPDYKLLQHMLAPDGNGFWHTTATEDQPKNSYYSKALTRDNLSELYLAVQTQTINKGRVSWVNQITDQWDLVVPPALEEAAWNIVKQDKIISPVDTTTVRGDKNFWFGKLGIRKFNQLGNTTMNTRANATRWFLWPKTARYAPFSISYLRNRRRPIIRVKEAPVDMLGFVVVGVFDVEINNREPSAIVRADSAAS